MAHLVSGVSAALDPPDIGHQVRWGWVVNVASVSGPVAAYPGDVAYDAAKAGMVGLTRAAAVELAGHGITVNAVAPGRIATATSVQERMGVLRRRSDALARERGGRLCGLPGQARRQLRKGPSGNYLDGRRPRTVC